VFPRTPDVPGEVVDTLSRIPLFTGRRLDDVVIERLGGLTNRNYKLTLGDDRYVLRLAGAGTDRYIDRAAELHNARGAAAIGIAPEIVHADPATGLLLTRFISGGVVLDEKRLQQPDALRATAATLKRLHASGADFHGRMELFRKLDDYLALAGAAVVPLFRETRAKAEAVRAALLRHPATLAPCHIDPVPHNFVMDSAGAIYLLDWEYSAMCEPVWDLAGLSIEAGLDAAAQDILLCTYYGAPTPRETARFHLHKIALALLAAAWAVVQLADGNTSGDFSAMANDRLARCRTAMSAPAFADQLGAASA
ncbi:MAG: phosphotransferase, partial [Dongiaceae bacterium]